MTAGASRTVAYLDRADSTQDVAFALLEERGGVVVVHSASQSAGRGRYGRSWVSLPGGVNLSVGFGADVPPDPLTLTQCGPLAVCEALASAFGLRPAIRLPNDVTLRDMKVAGALVEVRGDTRVLGVGVNVGARTIPHKLNATSLFLEGARDADPRALSEAVAKRVIALADEEPTRVFEAFRSRVDTVGKRVRFTSGAASHEGRLTALLPDMRVRVDGALFPLTEVRDLEVLA